MKTFNAVRAWGDDGFAALNAQTITHMARMTVDELAAAMDITPAVAEQLHTWVTAQVAPYTRPRIRPVDILAA